MIFRNSVKITIKSHVEPQNLRSMGKYPEKDKAIMSEKPTYQKELEEAAITLPENRVFYFNGYSISVSPHDVAIAYKNNNNSVAFSNTSHTIAKTLAKALLALIEDFENKAEMTVYTLDEIQEKLSDQQTD